MRIGDSLAPSRRDRQEEPDRRRNPVEPLSTRRAERGLLPLFLLDHPKLQPMVAIIAWTHTEGRPRTEDRGQTDYRLLATDYCLFHRWETWAKDQTSPGRDDSASPACPSRSPLRGLPAAGPPCPV